MLTPITNQHEKNKIKKKFQSKILIVNLVFTSTWKTRDIKVTFFNLMSFHIDNINACKNQTILRQLKTKYISARVSAYLCNKKSKPIEDNDNCYLRVDIK